METIKIYSQWSETLFPSETIVIAFLDNYQEKNQKSFFGTADDILEQFNCLSVGSIGAAISRGKKYGFLEVIGKENRNKVYKCISNKTGTYTKIPEFVFVSNKLSPLEKIMYAYIYSRPGEKISYEEMIKNLGIEKNRYSKKDLQHLVDVYLLVSIDKKYFTVAPIKNENMLDKETDWHERYQKRGKKIEKPGIKEFFIKLWNKLLGKKDKTKSKKS